MKRITIKTNDYYGTTKEALETEINEAIESGKQEWIVSIDIDDVINVILSDEDYVWPRNIAQLHQAIKDGFVGDDQMNSLPTYGTNPFTHGTPVDVYSWDENNQEVLILSSVNGEVERVAYEDYEISDSTRDQVIDESIYSFELTELNDNKTDYVSSEGPYSDMDPESGVEDPVYYNTRYSIDGDEIELLGKYDDYDQCINDGAALAKKLKLDYVQDATFV